LRKCYTVYWLARDDPKLEWQQIPLQEVMHTHHIDVKIGPIDNPVLSNPGAVNILPVSTGQINYALKSGSGALA